MAVQHLVSVVHVSRLITEFNQADHWGLFLFDFFYPFSF